MPHSLMRAGAAKLPYVGPNDEIRADIVEGLLSLPTKSADPDIHAPPPKRIKLAMDDRPSCRAHLIAKSELKVSRRCLDLEQLAATSHIIDAAIHLRLKITGDGRLLSITIPANRRTGRGKLNTVLVLRSEDQSAELATCIQAHAANEVKDVEGAVWTDVELRVDCHRKSADLFFSFSLYWNATTSPFQLRTKRQRALSQQVLDVFFTSNDHESISASGGWTPLDFYDAAFVPPQDDAPSQAIDVPGLHASLYPYQKRTIKWLLDREGVRWKNPEDGSLAHDEAGASHAVPAAARSFAAARDHHGQQIHLSRLYHAITTDTSSFIDLEKNINGGILSEEMGLGKTVEIISLICLHRRTLDPKTHLVSNEGEPLVQSGATIITCPESLRQQWMAELRQHAPHLRIAFYPGRGRSKIEDEETLIRHLAAQDVVITTYSILSAEVHYAKTPPDRAMRYERAFARPRSPLTRISWWRVCLDEAQMIESGVSSAALVARVLYRVNAWGVTGTPVKNDVKDLLGLLLFLRYEPYCSAPQVWEALTSRHKDVFHDLFNTISIRHTKKLVRDELHLPPQKRFVITVPFTAIEEQNYRQLFSQMAEASGMNTLGAPIAENWDSDDYEEEMRSWLNRLRQAALHPEIGAQNRRALGLRAGPLRTAEEVLDAMIERSNVAIRAEQRNYFSAKLAHGQMLENGPLVKVALSIWETTREEARLVVSQCRQELRVVLDEAGVTGGDLGRETEADDSDNPESGFPEELQTKGRIGEARLRLRSALEILHKAVFFCANAHFQIKENTEFTEPESSEYDSLGKLEEAGYDEAKAIRREILTENRIKATRLMAKLKDRASSQDFITLPELMPNPLKGIESAPVVEKIEQLYGALNEQANFVDELREQIIQLVTRPLVDEEDDAEVTGEELADSTKIQDCLMVFVQVLQGAVADRQRAITGLENGLIIHEIRTAKAMAKEGEGPAPEKLLELLDLRDKYRIPLEQRGSLRGAISELRELAVKFPRPEQGNRDGRNSMEHEIVTRQSRDTQTQINTQRKATQALERETTQYIGTMNARLDYYRQLQYVSDSVEPYEGRKDDVAIAMSVADQNRLHQILQNSESKHRYLLNLKTAGGQSIEQKMCIICQSTFKIGVLTVCGHQFCKECMMLWFKAHHNCPVCKKKLQMSDLHNITFKSRALKLHDGDESSEGEPDGEHAQGNLHGPKRNFVSKQMGIYSEFGAEKLAQIGAIEMEGSFFSSKVDAIVRHILWLRESDPGAKSIIFTQYRDFLGVLGTAFRHVRIGYASIDHQRGIEKFRSDPTIECFLLHGRAQSSGLNLVKASHVFLCEPLLNTALELQAIARVDRIGQQHETTIWLYLIQDTVEESIYNLSVRRRMEHMQRTSKGKSNGVSAIEEPALEEANTLEMEHAALSKLMSRDKAAGEAVDKNDLWECLFGAVNKPASDGRGEEGEQGGSNLDLERLLAAEAAGARAREQEQMQSND